MSFLLSTEDSISEKEKGKKKKNTFKQNRRLEVLHVINNNMDKVYGIGLPTIKTSK